MEPRQTRPVAKISKDFFSRVSASSFGLMPAVRRDWRKGCWLTAGLGQAHNGCIAQFGSRGGEGQYAGMVLREATGSDQAVVKDVWREPDNEIVEFVGTGWCGGVRHEVGIVIRVP